MTTLATDKPRVYTTIEHKSYPAIADDIIYEGAAVGLDGSGNARPLVAGDDFAGFCTEHCDNTGGSAGDKKAKVTNVPLELSIGSLAATDIGKPVYASDDDTFTLTKGANSFIGYVSQFVESGVGVVEQVTFAKEIFALTDSSGGSATDTIAAIGGTYSQSEVANAIASLAAKVNAVLNRDMR